ncbi:protein OSB3, chloroplastic/mitochondrial-like isoform X1 [Papaver somniferum]|uniref:protein OSB3, chloroplastic/mitochondrial-like isoform X1 n=1 Tax=Papaver somniferum TaxID=3469 RepID=UPI000E6F532C|nr:protein OSB3, chloroplastic/mitochondrial-like isoform X1 [Papaver somniferum]
MNLCKSFTEILSAKSTIKRLLNPLLVLQSSQFSSKPIKTLKESEVPELFGNQEELGFPFKTTNPLQEYVVLDVPKPKEIPWQSSIANSVNLIGSVSIPVQFEESDDGKFRAGTILSMEKTLGSTHLWIPLVFEGYLAHIAACHLKESDLIHVSGHLTGESPELSKERGHSSIQLMVRNISFVNESTRGKENCTTSKQDQRASSLSVNTSKDNSWRDLIDNPSQWTDYRKDKLDGLVKPKFPDFKRKDGGQALWIDGAPKWAISELQITFGKAEEFSRSNAQTQQESSSHGRTKKSSEESWKNLIDDPTNWWDNRAKKLNPKAPDFRNKVTREGIWLSSAPAWVSDKLPPVQTY